MGNNIENTSKNTFFGQKYTKMFSGIIRNNEFEIKRNIEYGYNHFSPNIIGKINEINDKTIISIKMVLNEIPRVFLTIIYCFALFLIVIGIFVTIIDLKNVIFLIAPLMISLFGLFLSNGCFEAEKEKSIEGLKNILHIYNIS